MEILENHAPGLLSAVGVAGFITATIMSARAAPKVYEILEETEEEPPLERAKAVAPVVAPTVGMIFLSTACIVASNRAYKQRYAGLLAMYSIGEKAMDRWQKAVVDEVGSKKAEKVRERAAAPTEDEPVPAVLLADNSGPLFFDRYSGRYFRAKSLEVIRQKINDLNDAILSGDWVSLNEFYYEIGLPSVGFGDDAGWAAWDNTINVEWYSFIHDGEAVIGMAFPVEPRRYE